MSPVSETHEKEVLARARHTSLQRFIDHKLPCAAAASKNKDAHCERMGIVYRPSVCSDNDLFVPVR